VSIVYRMPRRVNEGVLVSANMMYTFITFRYRLRGVGSMDDINYIRMCAELTKKLEKVSIQKRLPKDIRFEDFGAERVEKVVFIRASGSTKDLQGKKNGKLG